MEINKNIKNYRGYMLQGYAESLLKPEEVRTMYKKLKIVPNKISTFVDRKTIKEVYKYSNWNYFIIDTNSNVFVLDY